jgi:hypothetical protein
MPPRRKDSNWVALAWFLNIAGLAGIALVIGLYLALQPALAAAQEVNLSAPPSPSATSSSGVYYLPTVTPNPRSTMIVVESPTPFVLASGLRPAVIGSSVSGRLIEVYRFGLGEEERMIVAGIHGGYEWNTIALADQLITYISENPGIIPSDVSLFVLRNLNPDGDARDHGIDGRVNDHGVDLNRNFPVNWSADWDRDGCWNYGPTTGGTRPGSEPETRALMGFLMGRRIDVLISYHSAALGIFPGGEPWDTDSIRLAEALDGMTTYPFPPIDTGCTFTGTLADYAVSRGAAAVDMELTNHRDTDFQMNLKVLDLLLHWEP